MFLTNRLSVPVLLSLAGLLGASAVHAQDTTSPYNLASLQGTTL